MRFEACGLALGAIGPVSFRLASGQSLGLSGPSGAGKTRLLRTMADLDGHHGECFLDGVAARDHDAPVWRRRVAYLAAESAWWAETPGAHFSLTRDALAPTLAALDLSPELLERPIARLSSGQRQRLALARLIANEPRVLLLDEPTANLDGDNIARVERLIGERCAAHGACAVWVGHDHEQLARVADQHIRLDAHGRSTI